MYFKLFGILSLLCFCLLAGAQTNTGLIAYYPFDNGLLEDVTGNTANDGFTPGNLGFDCGVEEEAVAFNGISDTVLFLGPVNEEFNTEDFTVSFYFKATGANGIQNLLNKVRLDCSSENAFIVRYRPANRTLNVFMSETVDNSVNFVQQLSADDCWHHVTIVRDGNRIRLYIAGELVQELGTLGRIDLSNNSSLTLGGTRCLGANETFFEGLVDDLRFYNRSLDDQEVRGLYGTPDRIVTPDTTIFLGNSVPVDVRSACGQTFQWSPEGDIDNPTAQDVSITPVVPGTNTYEVRIGDTRSSCVARDQIRINVINPGDLDCTTLFLPSAFTPDGDGLNDTFGIDSPDAVETLISFEIFDRWGARVFSTTNPFDRWDGTFRGQEVNPGVMLYKAIYRCRGEELVATGSVTIIR